MLARLIILNANLSHDSNCRNNTFKGFQIMMEFLTENCPLHHLPVVLFILSVYSIFHSLDLWFQKNCTQCSDFGGGLSSTNLICNYFLSSTQLFHQSHPKSHQISTLPTFERTEYPTDISLLNQNTHFIVQTTALELVRIWFRPVIQHLKIHTLTLRR